ncbi:MAG: prolipoprotein diacylglyceryl transferase family protein, partial [Fidelibacterota bacterium]
LFFTYLIFAGSERFFIEFLRVNTKYGFGFSGSQLISLTMIGIGVWFLTHPVSKPQEEISEK